MGMKSTFHPDIIFMKIFSSPEMKKGVKICQGPVSQREPGDEVVTLVACGDIGLYGKLEEKLLWEGPSVILGDTMDVFKKADFIFGNLEGPVSDHGKSKGLPPPFPNLRMNPRSIDFLKEGGFDIVSLANNHMLDYGAEALLDTSERLDDARILHFGAGKNRSDACVEEIINVKDVKIGFIGFHEGGAVAKPDRPRACLFNKKNAISAIRKLRKRVDIVVVSFHFGFDYFMCPSPYHIRLCRQFIDEGADLILGHHPHVPQAAEKYKNGLIAYSLGNFAFYLGNDPPKKADEGFILKVNVTRSGIGNYAIIPYELDKDLVLKLLERGEQKKKIREYQELSDALKDHRILKQQWYESLRNFYLGYLIYYVKFDLLKGNLISFITRIIRLLNPVQPNRIKLKSLIYFIFTGYFIKMEIKRIKSKLSL